MTLLRARETVNALGGEVAERDYRSNGGHGSGTRGDVLGSPQWVGSNGMETDSLGLAHRNLRSVGKRFLGSRTHKASSAESILRHLLRQRGWTSLFKQDSLSGKRRLTLLRDIRDYGRAWLHHEAEEVFRSLYVARNYFGYTVATVDRGMVSGAASALSRFFRRAKTFLHELILAGSMAMSGPAPLTQREIDAVERESQKQTQYFDRFEKEVRSNPPKVLTTPSEFPVIAMPAPMTAKEFSARAEQYGTSTYHAGQRINRERVKAIPNAKLERRYLGHPKTHHCEDCPPLAAMGWQPIGTLPDIGDTECGGFCYCWFEYQDANGKTLITPTDYLRKNPGALKLPGGPGPSETRPKGGGGPEPKRLPRPLPSLEQLLKEAGSPYSADEYEEA